MSPRLNKLLKVPSLGSGNHGLVLEVLNLGVVTK